MADRVRPLVLVSFALIAACSAAPHSTNTDAQAGERQDPRAAICATAEAAGLTAAPPFDLIQTIFDQECTSCHSPGADLNLSRGVAWGNLVGRPAPVMEACGGTLVVPGDPDSSYLYQKLSVTQPCSGERMPRTEFAPAPLPDCVTALVRSWIASGAPGPGSDGGSTD